MTRILLLLALLAAGIVWAITPAGTIIRNQASAVLGGETYLSNEVDTLVKAICLPELGPNGSPLAPGQMVSGASSQQVYLPYRLSNQGNDRFSFDLGWAAHSSSSWIPQAARFYHDLNQNSQFDPGEPEVTKIELASGKSASLILALELPDNVLGEAYLTPTASCAGGERDEDNYALIRALDGPALQLFKSISQHEAVAGDTLSFRLRTINSGNVATHGPVFLTDYLNTASLSGLEYISGSASVSQGLLEYFDGTLWLSSEPPSVKGLRVSVADLSVAEQVTLQFQMQVLPGAAPGARENSATVTGPGGPAQVSVDFDILASYQHHLGPINNPRALPGGEASSDDAQDKDRLIFGQPSCFEHSIENAGSSQDIYLLDYEALPKGIAASLNTLQGEPLANPFELEAGEQRHFLFCLIASELTDAFTTTLTATSLASGESNLTFDRVEATISGKALGLLKEADKEGVVDKDEVITYTLTIHNDNPFDLHDLTISDALQDLIGQDNEAADESLQTAFISASHQGSFDSTTRTVKWHFDELASGASLSLELKVRMPSEPPFGDVFTLTNFFSLQAQELPSPLLSNRIFHSYPVIALLIEKDVSPTETRVGGILDYRITLSNPNNVEMGLRVLDKPDPRLGYIPGSAILTIGTTTKQLEPSQDNGQLIWNIENDADLKLAPRHDSNNRDVLTIAYQMVVKPGASTELINTAQAFGSYLLFTSSELSTQATGLSVASLEVKAKVIVKDAVFMEPDATLLGRVFLDVNEDDRYDKALDIPLPGARVVLSNGWQALTDGEGRYAFRDLSPGSWSIMLDPASAPFPTRPHPEAMADGYRHYVVLQGLTISDFPLGAPLGLIEVERRTVLTFGPLRLEKWLLPLPEGIRVVLRLSSSEVLPELHITDPIPDQEAKLFYFESFSGETTLSYDLPAVIPLTDPNARWRYP